MKHVCGLFITGMVLCNHTPAQPLEQDPVNYYEHLLADVMEVIDTNVLKEKCPDVEADYQKDPEVLNKARLGIIYHEMALNFMFLTKTSHTGYARKSYDLLNSLYQMDTLPSGLSPFIASYRASSLSLAVGKFFPKTRNVVMTENAIEHQSPFVISNAVERSQS